MTHTIVPLDSISIEHRQRKQFDEAALVELRESISSEKGLINPIFVRPGEEEGKYILVAGERRLRAIRDIVKPYNHGRLKVQPGQVPVIVKPFTDEIEIQEAELHENIIRVDLHWTEKVEAIKMLHELRVLRNPNHTPGMTAQLIDQSATVKKTGYAHSGTYEKVESSLLVAKHLDDPEVRSARNIKDARKVVSRKLELELLDKMRARRDDMAAKEKEVLEQAAREGIAPPPTPVLSSVLASLQPEFEFNLLEGDMKELIKEIPDGTINVVITDPPYNVGVANFGDSGKSAIKHAYSEVDAEELYRVLISELDRVCAPTAHVYIFCDIEFFFPATKMFSDEWHVRRTPLIWWKGTTGNLVDGGEQGYKRTYECIIYATRGKRPCAKIVPDVIPFPMVKDKIHAAVKPVALYNHLLEMSSVMGDTVLDAFAGYGTIYYAAQKHMIKVIGIELDPINCEMCKLAMKNKRPDWEPEL